MVDNKRLMLEKLVCMYVCFAIILACAAGKEIQVLFFMEALQARKFELLFFIHAPQARKFELVFFMHAPQARKVELLFFI